MKRILTVLCALLLVSGAALAEPREQGQALTVRTFTFKYKDADKAAAAIKTLLSADGTMSIQPAKNALVVTDHPDNLKAITKTLTDFDTAAQPIRLSVRIVAGTRGGAAQKMPDDLKDVASSLSVFHYSAYETIGSAAVQGKEGDPGVIDLAGGYRAEFTLGSYDPASDSVALKQLQISKMQKDQLTTLFTTSLNLAVGQTYVLGASRGPQSQRGLIIVLAARK